MPVCQKSGGHQPQACHAVRGKDQGSSLVSDLISRLLPAKYKASKGQCGTCSAPLRNKGARWLSHCVCLIKGNAFQEEAVEEATHSRGTDVEDPGRGSALKEKSLERKRSQGTESTGIGTDAAASQTRKTDTPRLRVFHFQCEALEKSWRL